MSDLLLPKGWKSWTLEDRRALEAELRSGRKRLLWKSQCRPDQRMPEGEWRVWYLQGSRAAGKTRAAAEAFAELIRETPGMRWGVVAPTYADARDVCMEGESGLLIALGAMPGTWKGGLVAGWNRSMGEAHLADGGMVWIDGADDGAPGVQGKNLAGVWASEIGMWLSGKETPRTPARWKRAWDESIQFAVRMAPAKIIADGTPKAGHGLVKRLITDPSVPKSRLYLKDNEPNLDPGAVAALRAAYEGTRLGRQELEGEYLDDVEGALWTMELIEPYRIDPAIYPDRAREVLGQLRRIVVAVDPSWGTKGDECGIIVCGLGYDNRGYVLEDVSGRMTPAEWGALAADRYRFWKADRLLAEINRQAEQVRLVMQTTDPTIPFKEVRVTRGKLLRAEPVLSLYEQGKISHIGRFGGLEIQMCEWVDGFSDFSPDRIDSLCFAIDELMLDPGGPEVSTSPARRRQIGTRA